MAGPGLPRHSRPATAGIPIATASAVTVLPPKLSRYAAVAALFLKYGRTSDPEPADAENMARDLESLGPTFVKLGQVLSTRADLLPAAYLKALARLQDAVEPVSFEDIQKVVESDLGVRLSKAFSVFEERPLAAASLGQVHRAALRDGRIVAVKVQRPGVAEQVAEDLDALDQIAQFVNNHSDAGKRYDLPGMVDEFRTAITAELDYMREAGHLRLIGEKSLRLHGHRGAAAGRRLHLDARADHGLRQRHQGHRDQPGRARSSWIAKCWRTRWCART